MMATVPFNPNRQVAPGVTPGAFDGRRATADQYGGQVGEAIAKTGSLIVDMAERERAKAREIQEQELDNEAFAQQNKVQNNFTQRKGKAAMEGAGQAVDDWNTWADKARENIADPEVRRRFDLNVGRRKEVLFSTIQKHRYQERQVYDADVTTGAMANYATAAADNAMDDDAVANAIRGGIEVHGAHAFRNERPAESVQAEQRAWSDRVMADVLQKRVVAGDTEGAKRILEQYPHLDQKGVFKKANDENEMNKRVYDQVDQMDPSAISLGDGLKQIQDKYGDNKNTEERLKLTSAWKTKWNDHKVARDEVEDKTVEAIYDAIERGEDINSPEYVAAIAALPANKEQNLKEYIARKNAPAEATTNLFAYAELSGISANRDEFLATNIPAKYGHLLSPAHVTKFIDLQKTARDNASDPKYVSLVSNEDILKSRLADSPYIKAGMTEDKKKAVYIAMSMAVEKQLKAMGKTKETADAPAMVQAIDRALMNKVTDTGWTGVTVPIVLMKDDMEVDAIEIDAGTQNDVVRLIDAARMQKGLPPVKTPTNRMIARVAKALTLNDLKAAAEAATDDTEE